MALTKAVASRPHGELSLLREGTGVEGDADHEVVSSLNKPLVATSF